MSTMDRITDIKESNEAKKIAEKATGDNSYKRIASNRPRFIRKEELVAKAEYINGAVELAVFNSNVLSTGSTRKRDAKEAGKIVAGAEKEIAAKKALSNAKTGQRE